MNVLLLGPQGSGKGTQAKRIQAEYAAPHIATGEILRAAIEAESELGRRVKPIVESGQLVPDDLMIELIRERLREDDAQSGFILDGFPRTLPQAQALDEMLGDIGRELSIVFGFQLEDSVGIERMTKRATLEQRKDDTPEAIAQRLELYHRETEPLIDYYRAQGNLVGVHADHPVDHVFAEIQEALEQTAARSA
ncbi:MAG: adenylate kinase [Gaiellaceae bacterium]